MKKYFNLKPDKNIINKAVIFTVLLVLFSAICSTTTMAYTGSSQTKFSSEPVPVSAPKSLAFVEHQNNNTPSQTTSIYGHINDYTAPPVDFSHLKPVSSANLNAVALPAQYDLGSTTPIRVTPVKNQGVSNTCWAFGTYGFLESYFMSMPTPENWSFSENNMKNELSANSPQGYDRGANDAGNYMMSSAYLNRWSGPVKTSDDPFVDTSTFLPIELTYPIQKHVQNIRYLALRNSETPTANDEIKTAIMDTGAVGTLMYWGDSYYNPATYSYYYNGAPDTNHGVTIVGWNDNYSASNFSTTPPGNGAFIIKNSWGTTFGDSGYFYVSYYDTALGAKGEIAQFTAEPLNNYTNVYLYDPLGETNELGYTGTNTLWGANIFTASSNEVLKATSFYTTDTGTSYMVKIYNNVGTQPDQGTLVLTQSGTIPNAGYHTVPLSSDVPLTTGQNFSVVIELTNPTYQFPMAVEQPIPSYSSQAVATAGQSFVSVDGNTWYDLTTLPGWSNTNTCIKAFTNEANAALTITKTPNPLIYSASGQTITYTYTVKNTGNVELNAVNVVDSTLGPITLLSTDLAPNAQTTGTAIYQIKQADLNAGSVSNTATVYNGTQQLNQTTAEILAIQSPALTITKTPNPLTYSASGQTITYTYTVKNTGNVELNAVKVVDSILGQITLLITDLAPNAQTTGTATYQTTVADMNAGSVSNTATVYNGTLQLNQTQATITATQPSPNPALTITKTPNPLTYSASGQTITYTYTVKNTGNVELNAVKVVDSILGQITLLITDLAPNAQTTGTATYQTTVADMNAGSVSNTATVYNGTLQLNQTQATITATQPSPNPALTITKTPNPLTYSASGQTITYTYTVKNTGNVELNAVKVVDSILGQITLLSTDLAPNAQTTGMATYQTTVTDMNAGSVSNTATVYNGTLQLNQTTAKVTATQPSPNPALTITKTPNPLTYSASGQTITYTYTVKNTGNVEIKGPITVTDDKFGIITIPNSDTLNPGSSVTGTATYKITQANIDEGHVTNAAFATGSFNSQPVISPSAIAIVRYEQPTKKEEHNEEEHNGDRDNYGGPIMWLWRCYNSYDPWTNVWQSYDRNEPYGYGGEPYGPTETLIRNLMSTKLKPI